MPLGQNVPPKTTASGVEELCRQYEVAQEKLIAHRDRHRQVYAKEGELYEEMEVLKAQIKAAFHERAKRWKGRRNAYEGSTIFVQVTPKNDRDVDMTGLFKELPTLRYVPGVVNPESVNNTKLLALVKSGDLDEAVLNRHSRFTPGTPSVEFKLVTDAKE
jgi:hypothetical protein